VDVGLVDLFVNVTDAYGAPVNGLRKEDFAVTEDGHPETVRVFEQESGMPLSIVLAVDTSLSVHIDLGLEKEAAHNFVHAMLRPQDRMELLSYAAEVRRQVPFTRDQRDIDHGIDRLHGVGPTALYAAIAEGARDLEDSPGRKVMVVVGDGDNSMEGVSYDEAREGALRAQAMVYSIIIVPIEASAGRDIGGEHALVQLSEDTGGKYLYVEGPQQMQAAFARISEDLRTQYLLGYYPGPHSGGPGFRRTRVRLTSPSLAAQYQLRYRTGYYAQGGTRP
jgi:Ca-activated chloride channel family protein